MFEDFFFPKLDWKFDLRLFFTGAAVWGDLLLFFHAVFY